VLIQKADAVTRERLAGAELEIRNEAGMPVFTGITNESGLLSFQPPHVGKFTVHEIKAPEGYRKTDTYLTIYVTDAGTATGEFVMYNSPVYGKKKGFITATYRSNLSSLGIINYKGRGFWSWLSRLPKTGDIGLDGGLLLLIGLSGIISGIAIVRRKRDKKDE